MNKLAQLDHRYVWHPFTQMKDWLAREPVVIASGEGALLRDIYGREYLDANSSIWTNLHGHRHPRINRAIEQQLKKIAHSSALGLANEPAALLAKRLVKLANPLAAGQTRVKGGAEFAAARSLTKVFYSDDGSTALEVALKLAYEFARRTGRSRNPKFLSLQGAYHGDTIGAVSLGKIDLFHKAYQGLLFKTDTVMAPYCYRCPFNRAKPERADAREYRECHWECVRTVEEKFASQKKRQHPYTALVVEPLIQGAAGMIPQPSGWLRQVSEISRHHGALLVADEVMTGFGRTGVLRPLAGMKRRMVRGDKAGNKTFAVSPNLPDPLSHSLFACHHESVQPDLLALAKGLTGGYLPMAATLSTQEIFDAFLGEYEEFKTFFHGHSYTGNQLGAAAALANLDILESKRSLQARERLEEALSSELASLWNLPNVGDIRQAGLVAGIELVKDWKTRKPFPARERAGIRVCEAMAMLGVLTRPIGNVIVLMPPYCTTRSQLTRMVRAAYEGIQQSLGS